MIGDGKSKKDTLLYIGSYNVHDWEDADSESNTIRIIDALNNTDIDILGICECNCDAKFAGRAT